MMLVFVRSRSVLKMLTIDVTNALVLFVKVVFWRTAVLGSHHHHHHLLPLLPPRGSYNHKTTVQIAT